MSSCVLCTPAHVCPLHPGQDTRTSLTGTKERSGTGQDRGVPETRAHGSGSGGGARWTPRRPGEERRHQENRLRRIREDQRTQLRREQRMVQEDQRLRRDQKYAFSKRMEERQGRLQELHEQMRYQEETMVREQKRKILLGAMTEGERARTNLQGPSRSVQEGLRRQGFDNGREEVSRRGPSPDVMVVNVGPRAVIDLTQDLSEGVEVQEDEDIQEVEQTDEVQLALQGISSRHERHVVQEKPEVNEALAKMGREEDEEDRGRDGAPPQCPICLEGLQHLSGGRSALATTCGHLFCSTCLPAALATSSTCPTCRTNLAGTISIRIFL